MKLPDLDQYIERAIEFTEEIVNSLWFYVVIAGIVMIVLVVLFLMKG
jgi:bacteriorhodopsin